MFNPSVGQPKSLIPNLVAARGLAALMVAGFHCGQTRWTNGDLLYQAYDRQHAFTGWLNQLVIFLCNGHAAVNFFFVLSGFVLTYSASSWSSSPKRWWLIFLTRRVFRIYPAVIATILIFYSVYCLTGLTLPGVKASDFRASELLLNMLLVHTSIDGVMWSLRVEVLAMPLIALCIVLGRHGRTKRLIPLALIMTLFHFWGDWRETMGAQFAFVYGAIACASGDKLLPRSATGRSLCGGIACLLLLLPRCVLSPSSLWNAIIESAVSGLLVSYLASANQGPIARNLQWPWLQRFGEASYSFYLLHPLCLLLFWRSQPLVEQCRSIGIPSAALVLLMTMTSSVLIGAMAWTMWRVVELPCSRVGRHWPRMKHDRPGSSLPEVVCRAAKKVA